MYVYVCVCMYGCFYAYVCVYVCVCVFVCMHVLTYKWFSREHRARYEVLLMAGIVATAPAKALAGALRYEVL